MLILHTTPLRTEIISTETRITLCDEDQQVMIEVHWDEQIKQSKGNLNRDQDWDWKRDSQAQDVTLLLAATTLWT